MKAALVFLLPLLAEAASIQFRQLGGKKAKAVYTYDTKPLKATIRADAQRTLTRVGPIDLVPGNTGRHGMSLDANGEGVFLSIPKNTFCGGDCTILSGHVGLEFENGTQADVSKNVYIHHILSSNDKKKIEPFIGACDTTGDVKGMKRPAKIGAGFIGVSDDNGNEPLIYGTKDKSILGGYWLSKDQPIGVWADLVNLDQEPKKVYITYDLQYIPGHEGVDAQGSLISVTGCNPTRKIATPTSGPANTTSGKFRFFQDGFLINGKGHLHDGGVAMDFHINDKYVCSSNAIYGGKSGTNVKDGKKWETISGMSLCPGPIKVKDGDYMSMVARYDLTQHPLRENGDHHMAEVMGMWTMNFLPAAGAKALA